MTITSDEMEHDKLQHQLIREIAKSIKFELEQAGVPEERLYDAVGSLAFSVASILDGNCVMECDGKPLIPVVTFALDAERQSLVASPSGSCMHEYAHGDVDEMFLE